MLFSMIPRSILPALLCLGLLSTGMRDVRGQGPVAPSAEQICPLKTGSKVPGVVFTKLDGSSLDLLSRTSEKPTIMIFYRGGW